MAHNFKLNDEDTLIATKRKQSSAGIVGLLIKTGLVKTPGQANALMVLIVVVGMIAIVVINLRTFGG